MLMLWLLSSLQAGKGVGGRNIWFGYRIMCCPVWERPFHSSGLKIFIFPQHLSDQLSVNTLSLKNNEEGPADCPHFPWKAGNVFELLSCCPTV